jgi:tetratricopeptide (TPR) repeat protein
MEIDHTVHLSIVSLSEEGDMLADQYCFIEALEKYHEALNLLPKPVENWDAALWLFVAIGDAYFFDKNFSEAFEWFKKSIYTTDGAGNPFVHMRLGECALELHDIKYARDELMRAFMLGGTELFDEEDPKYLNTIEDLIKLGTQTN